MTASKTVTVTPPALQITTLAALLKNPRARKWVLMALRHQREKAKV